MSLEDIMGELVEPDFAFALSKHCVICCGPCEESSNGLDQVGIQPDRMFNFLCAEFNVDANLREETAPEDFSIATCDSCTKATETILRLEEEIKLIRFDVQIHLQDMKKAILESNDRLIRDFGIQRNNNLLSPLEHTIRQQIIEKSTRLSCQ